MYMNLIINNRKVGDSMEEQNNTQQQTQQQTQPTPTPTPAPVRQADPADVEKNKTMAILAYFLFFIPLLTDAKDSPFAKFHANQSLVLLIFSFGGYIVASVLTVVLIGFLLYPVIMIASLVFFVMGLINASNGQMKELPLIGGIHLLDK